MRNAGLDETQTRVKIVGRNINNLRYADGTILMAENEEKLRSLLKVKDESKRAGLKFNFQKSKIMAPSPIALHGKSMGNNGNCERLYFLGLQNHCRW